MSCHGHNATAPGPAIAPGHPGTPSARSLDPSTIARSLVARHGAAGMDPRVRAIIPGFDAPMYQAGLAGYSDAAMRIIARRLGCPLCVTEALLDRTLLAGGRGFAKADLGAIEGNVPGGDEDHPLVGQIMGSVPEEMAAAAVKMVEQGSRRAGAYRALAARASEAAGSATVQAGQRSFDAIDLNFACPVKKIARKARGGHLLTDPATAIAIMEAVRGALPDSIPVTVKMRRSFDDSPAMAEAFDRILDAAFGIGCAWVTVHGRTVSQKYLGPSRWDVLREIVSRNPGRVIFGSGDIWSAGDVFRMIGYTGVTGVSVARGCIGNPWIFRQCRELLEGEEPAGPSLAEQRRVLLEHCTLALHVNRMHTRSPLAGSRLARADEHTARTMRKFGIRFADHHPRARAVRDQFIACRTMEQWEQVIDRWYPEEDNDEQQRPAV